MQTKFSISPAAIPIGLLLLTACTGTISGPLDGEQLAEGIPARFSFWFAFIAAFPEATAYAL